MRKLKRILIIFTSLFATFMFLSVMFFGDFNSFSKYKSINDWFKKHYGGVVVNKTNHNIFIKQWINEIVLPPGMSSRDAGIFDADFFTIKNKTIFENKLYTQGDIKLCDFAKFEIREKDKESVDYIDYSIGYTFCKVFPFIVDFKKVPH